MSHIQLIMEKAQEVTIREYFNEIISHQKDLATGRFKYAKAYVNRERGKSIDGTHLITFIKELAKAFNTEPALIIRKLAQAELTARITDDLMHFVIDTGLQVRAAQKEELQEAFDDQESFNTYGYVAPPICTATDDLIRVLDLGIVPCTDETKNVPIINPFIDKQLNLLHPDTTLDWDTLSESEWQRLKALSQTIEAEEKERKYNEALNTDNTI